MSLSKPLTVRHLCHLLNKILGLFYHRHIVFFTISWLKNTKCYLPKKGALEWPRNKLSATTCQVPQNGYNNFLIGFFHSETNLKVLLAQLGIDPRPRGLRTPQPWPLHRRANCWTAALFSFYLLLFPMRTKPRVRYQNSEPPNQRNRSRAVAKRARHLVMQMQI